MDTRYDIFNLIHKGLRLMLYDTGAKLQRADFGEAKTESTINQLEELIHYFEQHAHHEDQIILPLVNIHDPNLVDRFGSQHEEDHRLGITLATHIQEWKKSTDKHDKQATGKKLVHAFQQFVGFNLYHMNAEEQQLNPVLWQNYTDAQLMQATQRILGRIEPGLLIRQSRWIIKAISQQERLTWLVGMRNTVPPEVLQVYARMAQQELPIDEWLELRTALYEDAAA